MAAAPILLSELIAELRRELAEAQVQGQGIHPRLRIEEAEIECTRSASENFMVAMTAVRSVPCRHGQSSGIPT
jgi:NTP-dependent ternary system trypsin peptidase co-occuring protein